MREEQFDVLDCDGRKTGRIICRDDAHASGTWHGAFHCLIIYRRQGRAYALFQKRSGAKRIAPNRYDVSVGGHYASGEGAEQAGPREIAEELGLTVPFAALVPVGKRVFVHCFTPGVRECEFQDVFLLPCDGRPVAIVPGSEEVQGVLELAVDDGISLFSGQLPEVRGMFLDERGEARSVGVKEDEFVPCLDRYYLKILVLVQRYFRGETTALAI